MNLAAIRDGIKARLDTVPGLRASDTVPDSVAVPTQGEARAVAVVLPPEGEFITYHSTMGPGALAEVRLKVTVLASKSSTRTGQDAIDALLSSGENEDVSVIDAIEADGTLGGVVDDCIVETAGDYGTTEVGGTTYLKADLNLLILARRT